MGEFSTWSSCIVAYNPANRFANTIRKNPRSISSPAESPLICTLGYASTNKDLNHHHTVDNREPDNPKDNGCGRPCIAVIHIHFRKCDLLGTQAQAGSLPTQLFFPFPALTLKPFKNP